MTLKLNARHSFLTAEVGTKYFCENCTELNVVSIKKLWAKSALLTVLHRQWRQTFYNFFFFQVAPAKSTRSETVKEGFNFRSRNLGLSNLKSKF